MYLALVANCLISKPRVAEFWLCVVSRFPFPELMAAVCAQIATHDGERRITNVPAETTLGEKRRAGLGPASCSSAHAIGVFLSPSLCPSEPLTLRVGGAFCFFFVGHLDGPSNKKYKRHGHLTAQRRPSQPASRIILLPVFRFCWFCQLSCRPHPPGTQSPIFLTTTLTRQESLNRNAHLFWSLHSPSPGQDGRRPNPIGIIPIYPRKG